MRNIGIATYEVVKGLLRDGKYVDITKVDELYRGYGDYDKAIAILMNEGYTFHNLISGPEKEQKMVITSKGVKWMTVLNNEESIVKINGRLVLENEYPTYMSVNEMAKCILTHKEVVERYKEVMGNYKYNQIDQWYPNGLNSIRIIDNRLNHFAFTYINDEHWLVESIGHHIEYTMKNISQRENKNLTKVGK